MGELWREKVQCGVVGSSFVMKYVTRWRAGEFGWVMKSEESEKVIFIGGGGTVSIPTDGCWTSEPRLLFSVGATVP